MWLAIFNAFHRGRLRRNGVFRSLNHIRVTSLSVIDQDKSLNEFSTVSVARNIQTGSEKLTLATNLASLLEETCDFAERKKPKTRIALKRCLENRIKKRVKECYVDGKFHNLLEKVIADRETLRDAYDCIRLDSNVDITVSNGKIPYESMAEELCSGRFDVKANIFSLVSKGTRKEYLVLPKQKLQVVQEAVRVVLEVIYRPHFSKISHGCRSGRGHASVMGFIKKDAAVSDWWFTVSVSKKPDIHIFDKLISLMEEKIEDQNLFSLIRSMFYSKVLNLEFGGFPKGYGLPQEGRLSPILMNIYLDLFDREFYRMSMKYEALSSDSQANKTPNKSKLRSWFRRNLKGNDVTEADDESLSSRVYSCRYMDEIFFAVSGSEDAALKFKYEILNFIRESLLLDVHDKTKLLPCRSQSQIRIMGTLVERIEKESPAMKAVHKLKEKVEYFALQKEEAWNFGTYLIGRKWLGHGLRKVEKSERKPLGECELHQFSHLRKPGMKTDHWYMHLLKVWMQDINAKKAKSVKSLLAEFVAEPALPKELTDSYHEFQRRVKEYVSAEIASTNALFPIPESQAQPTIVTNVIAPVESIQKRFFRYNLASSSGHPRPCPALVPQTDDQIIDWFSGIVRRWLRWYSDCDNFSEVKLLICRFIRTSCILTLVRKHGIPASLIEVRFDDELSRIPSQGDLELEMVDESSDMWENTEALMYGIYYASSCMLSVPKKFIDSGPHDCVVMGCLVPAPSVYNLHIMERQKFPTWKTGLPGCIHPTLNRLIFGLCDQHLKDLYLGNISLQSIDFAQRKSIIKLMASISSKNKKKEKKIDVKERLVPRSLY